MKTNKKKKKKKKKNETKPKKQTSKKYSPLFVAFLPNLSIGIFQFQYFVFEQYLDQKTVART